MKRHLREPYETGWRVAAVLFVITVLVASGFAVGKAKGRHEAKLAAWRECARRYEQAAARLTLVRRADPCETWR